MENTNVSVDVVKTAYKEVTCTVRLKRIKEFKFRMWLAEMCFRLGAWILPADSRIEIE